MEQINSASNQKEEEINTKEADRKEEVILETQSKKKDEQQSQIHENKEGEVQHKTVGENAKNTDLAMVPYEDVDKQAQIVK